MFSKILLRLIDESILPAILVIAAKFMSMAIIIWAAGVSWELSLDSTPGILFAKRSDMLLVNSYSNLAVIGLLGVGLLWIMIRATHFHETHISPRFALKLLSWDMTGLITSSVEIYHQALVWLSYLWLFVIMAFMQAVLGWTYGWTVAVGFMIAGFITWLLIADVEREISA